MHRILREQRIANLDVDVNIRERFKLLVAAFFGVVGVLQQLNPQTQTADVHGVRVDIHTEETIFDNAARNKDKLSIYL